MVMQWRFHWAKTPLRAETRTLHAQRKFFKETLIESSHESFSG
jgi:hypothetical protein